MSTVMSEQFEILRKGLSKAELENYKLFLCMAAGGLAPRGCVPMTVHKAEAFETVLHCLSELRPSRVPWKGRPTYLTDELLRILQSEAAAKRKVAKPTDRYLLGCGGEVADQFARHVELERLVQVHFPGVKSTGIASYIFYDQVGHGLDPHVDTEIYSVNVILMLQHEFRADPSHLLLYNESRIPERVLLAPGEMIIITAGSTVHAREDMKRDESISLLTIGFAYND